MIILAKLQFAIQGIIFLIMLLLSFLFCIIPLNIMKLARKTKAVNYWARTCLKIMSAATIHLLGIKIEDKTVKRPDLSKYERICFVGNHTSVLDIPVYNYGLGIFTAFIAKQELSKVPIINTWITCLDCIYLKRSNLRQSANAIGLGVEKIKNGTPFMIFPEGTRSKTGVIGRFKGGSFKLATRSGATLIPLVIKGVRGGFEQKVSIRRIHAKVQMLDPIDTTNLTPDEIRDLPQRVQNLIEQAYQKL